MRSVLRVALGLLAIALGASAEGREPEKKEKNTITIRKTAKGDIEFELTSGRAFPVISAAPVLSVGKETSRLSRYGPDGRLTTIIFSMTAEQFAKTKDGDAISVRYTPDSQGVWEFGKLDKKVLDK